MPTFRYLLAAALLSATPAAARDGRWSVGVTAGSLGVGPQVGYRLNRHVGARASATFLDIGFGIDTDDVDYDATVSLRSGGLALDLYPTGSGLRVSAGVRYSENAGFVDGLTKLPVDIGSITLSPEEAGHILADVTTDEWQPLVTIGYGGKLRRGFAFTVDAGVMFQGKAKVSELRSQGGTLSPAFFQQTVVRLAAAEERAKLQEDVDPYQLFPILQFGLIWRF